MSRLTKGDGTGGVEKLTVILYKSLFVASDIVKCHSFIFQKDESIFIV